MNSSSLETVQIFKLVLIHTVNNSMDCHGAVLAEAVPSVRVFEIVSQGTRYNTAKYNL